MEKITINGVEYKLTPIENELDNKKSPYGEKRDFGYFEEKSADKIEPKFKVGDWLVNNERKNIIKVVNHTPLDYEVVDILGYHHTITDTAIEKNYHLWTIEDAKDGDVIIYDDGWSCIFKHIHGTWYSSYCFITDDGEFHTGYDRHDVGTTVNGNANPTTKEQRDLLFQKMREAGYEWDAEKKVLKKIERESTWSEGDENVTDIILSQLRSDNFSGVLSKSLLKEAESWLKSLKDRVQPQNHWKPSEEQLKSLQEVIDVGYFTSYPNSLETLYEQLKKLKGE